MIFVAGTLVMDPKNTAEFDRDVRAMLKDVRAEKGCRHYSLTIDDAARGVINVHEVWEDDDALAEHFKQPWIVSFFAKHGPRMTEMNVKVYDISGVRDLPAM